jgi:arsenite methyltransferase
MAELIDTDDIRETVRERYAAAARAAGSETSCCGSEIALTDAAGEQVFGGALYRSGEAADAPTAAVEASLGCGVPTAVAALHEGETVLDLGSGAGFDALISARRVGSTGMAIGLDMTDEMLELARRNAAEAGATNVEFLKGHIEDIPLPAVVAWTGCIAGALTREEFERALRDAGLIDIEITETHRVHEKAASAIIRARRPEAGEG